MKLNLRLDLKAVAEAARRAKNIGGYDGPPPPNGRYRTELVNLSVDTDKNNKPIMIAQMRINEPLERGGKKNPLAGFNGFTYWNRFDLELDPTDQYFDIRVGSIDDFVREVTVGRYGVVDFLQMSGTDNGLGTKVETTRDGKKHFTVVTRIGEVELKPGIMIDVQSKLSTQVNKSTGLPYANVQWIFRSNESLIAEEKYTSQVEDSTPAVEEEPENVPEPENAIENFTTDPGEILDSDVQDDDNSEEFIEIDDAVLGLE